ncbi:hypothetical protein Q5752_006342 [Cryptotrichosporon argae]
MHIAMPLPRVFFDFTVAEQPLGRVVFELFADVVPKTAENFRLLCAGFPTPAGGHLTYAGSPVHRVVAGFMLQGGDFTKRNGTGGQSVYGGMFEDERLDGPGSDVDREGLLVMANRGPNTNGSQWFITLAPSPHLTGKHVVFGRVVAGMQHVKTIGALATDSRDRPLSPVVVAHCGELEYRAPARPASSAGGRSPEPRRGRSESRARSARSDSFAGSRSRSRSPVRADKRRARSYSASQSPSRSRSPSPRREREKDARDKRDRKERKERRRDRREKRGSKRKPRSRRRDDDSDDETLSELDARLEREEKERLEVARREREAREREELERERQAVKDAGGVVYKGRGAMRYLDPESRPANYDARSTPTWGRGRGRGGRGEAHGHRDGPNGRSGERWERGVAVPRYEREGARGGGGGGRDMDRWDAGGRMGDGAVADAERDRVDRVDRSDRGGREARVSSLLDRLERRTEAGGGFVRSTAEGDAESTGTLGANANENGDRNRDGNGDDEGREARKAQWGARATSPRRSRSRSLERRDDSDMELDDD